MVSVLARRSHRVDRLVHGGPYRGVTRLTSLGALVAGACLLLACTRLLDRDAGLVTVSLLAAGSGLWLQVLRSVDHTPEAPLAEPRGARGGLRRDIVLTASALGIAGVAAAVAYRGAADNTFRLWGVIAWAVAALAWTLALWPRSVQRGSSLSGEQTNADLGAGEGGNGDAGSPSRAQPGVGIWLALLLIVAVGGILRFHTLQSAPSNPTSDHAEKLLDVGDLLAGERPIYLWRNTGREPLQFYITAFGLIRGLDMPVRWHTLKVGTAAIDTLAIVAVFLLARELAGAGTGLLAAALYATAAWPTIIGVFGLRPGYGSLTAAAALWAFLRLLRTGDRRDALLAGWLLGVGLYGYTAFRTLPIAVGAGLLLALGLGSRLRATRRELLLNGGVVFTTAGIVAIPLARVAVQFPDLFWYRTRTRTSGTADTAGVGLRNVLNDVSVFIENNWHAAQMFHWRGDVAFVSFAPGRPALDLVTGAALMLGILFAAYRAVAGRDARYAALLVALPILALSSTLAIAYPHESPSFSRSVLLAPIVFTLAAIGLDRVRRAVSAAGAHSSAAWAAWLLMVPLVVVVARENRDLIAAYDANYRASIANTDEIVQAIEGGATVGVDLDHTYLIGAPNWLDHRNVAFELGDISWGDTNHIWMDMPLPDPGDGAPLLFVVKHDDLTRRAELRAKWPNGIETVVSSAIEGREFMTYFVPGATQEGDGTTKVIQATHVCRVGAWCPR